MIPQIIFLCLLTMSITIHLINHGENRPPYNVWHKLIGAVILFALLWWGGFWEVFNI